MTLTGRLSIISKVYSSEEARDLTVNLGLIHGEPHAQVQSGAALQIVEHGCIIFVVRLLTVVGG